MSNKHTEEVYDFFGDPKVQEIIIPLIDEIDNLRNIYSQSEEENNKSNLSEISLFENVFKDITGLNYDAEKGYLIVNFDRGIDIKITGTQKKLFEKKQVFRSSQYRLFLMVGKMIQMGLIRLRISPFSVKAKPGNGVKVHRYKRSTDNKLNNMEYSTNPHDNEINCWGGWSYEVINNLISYKIEDALFYIYERMRQINIDDIGLNNAIMVRIFNTSYADNIINLDVNIVASLFLMYKLDEVINDSFYNHSLEIKNKDGILFLFGKKTNIYFDDLLESIVKLKPIYEKNPIDVEDLIIS